MRDSYDRAVPRAEYTAQDEVTVDRARILPLTISLAAGLNLTDVVLIDTCTLPLYAGDASTV